MTPRAATFRVEWVPGSDTLTGTCFCRARSTAQDPASLLDWLAAHPVGHESADAPAAPPVPVLEVARAH